MVQSKKIVLFAVLAALGAITLKVGVTWSLRNDPHARKTERELSNDAGIPLIKDRKVLPDHAEENHPSSATAQPEKLDPDSKDHKAVPDHAEEKHRFSATVHPKKLDPDSKPEDSSSAAQLQDEQSNEGNKVTDTDYNVLTDQDDAGIPSVIPGSSNSSEATAGGTKIWDAESGPTEDYLEQEVQAALNQAKEMRTELAEIEQLSGIERSTKLTAWKEKVRNHREYWLTVSSRISHGSQRILDAYNAYNNLYLETLSTQ